jgi:hypothetical protein
MPAGRTAAGSLRLRERLLRAYLQHDDAFHCSRAFEGTTYAPTGACRRPGLPGQDAAAIHRTTSSTTASSAAPTAAVRRRQACRLVELPEGARAFVYEGGLYYQPVSPIPSHECPYGGVFDSRNCLLGAAPDGSEPYAVGHRIDTPALCGPTTDWQGVLPGEVRVQNVCR